MKTKVIVAILTAALIALVSYYFYKKKSGGDTVVNNDILYYTCVMHPQIHVDEPGDCPICHMRLVPVRKPDKPNSSGTHDAHSVQPGATVVDIPVESQRLISLRTAPAVKKRIIKEIRTTGIVAFDPELAVAIREYIEIGGRDPQLRSASISRLRLLGMGDDEIRILDRNPRAYANLFVPEGGSTVWVYASIYEGDTAYVRSGMRAIVRPTFTGARTFTGIIRSISPVVNATTRTLKARIEISPSDPSFHPNSYVNVTIQVDQGTALTIPRSALVDTGSRQIVYVMTGESRFESRAVVVGTETEDDIVVISGVKEGEKVVTDATFLVDSESQLRSTTAPGHEH